MAGSVPDNPTPTDVLKLMDSNMHAQIIEQFLLSATSSAADCLPTGCDPFMKFVQLRSAHSAHRREETHSSASRVQTAMTVDKRLAAASDDATFTVPISVQQSVFTDAACVNALRVFAESRHVHSIDNVLRTIPASARALLMGRFQPDDSLALTQHGAEARRGVLQLIAEILPKRVGRVVTTAPHGPKLNTPSDESKLSSAVVAGAVNGKASPFNFTTRRALRADSWDAWSIHLSEAGNKHCWRDEFADAVDLFVEAVTAAHGFGEEIAATPHDPLAVERDLNPVISSQLVSHARRQITFSINCDWLEPWMKQYKSIAAKVRENRSTVEQKKFYVRPEHLVGTEETLLRALTMAFAAAIEQGQRTGERATYKEMADRHYVGPGSGLASAIERFNGCTNVEQRNTNGAALQLDEITKEYDKRIEHLTNLVHAGRDRDSGRDGGRQRHPRPDNALHVPPMPTIPPPTPPPMPPPYQPPRMPNLQMPPPHHLQPPWAPPAGPPAAPIPAPYAFQQPGLGLRHDGMRAEPPLLYQRPPGDVASSARRPPCQK